MCCMADVLYEQDELPDSSVDSDATGDDIADMVNAAQVEEEAPEIHDPPVVAHYGTRLRHARFTLNNPTPSETDRLRLLASQDLCRYLVFSHEVAPSTGTPHLQGYVCFNGSVVWNTIKERLGHRVAFYRCDASFKHNYDYVRKLRPGDTPNEHWEEFGTKPAGLKRGRDEQLRWQEAFSNAKAGKFEDIPPDIVVRNYVNLRRIQRDYATPPPDLIQPCGVWIHGISGAGKSHFARHNWPGAYLKLQNKWWDSYQGQDFVILDDFDKNGTCLSHHLKIWSDKYSFAAEIKGSQIMIRPKKFIITSQYTINELWPDESDHEIREALHRRFVDLFCHNHHAQ